MSKAGLEVEVECDGCRRVEPFRGITLDEAHRLVDEAGWLRNVSRDQDICPNCVTARAGYHIPKQLL